MRIALFWAITLRAVIILNRRFGTTYKSHLHGKEPKNSPWILWAYHELNTQV